ncbi:MAG: hypothetical protein PHQ67_00105 [Fermentimonas sp.]|nr:hypothetical protein [Fermentimonas sp.]MDD4008192.1 hypothetical protein [Fermentimonas sp.]MDD4696685.1 hypothetical protein [Fermentimonas sp.]
MSLIIPDIPDNNNGYKTGKAGPSKFTSTIIRQFAACIYIENRLSFPERILCLN